ncbi:uncharacterized protein HMPREF1120_06557 [Exophiala dermatitidis NIH/UT8656]|uniref:Uncharacterized protein n=1 Tax=Exophiala dermatitidis (strain ATCC 34100 / CBS 525.76 / NIH/UT8656) TaxID=858893 RepID=H6C4X1_EXODN|nr:uncharacterized protein HMPREF1120_06557 [Exophiala dermatitidis NIH/UT8656]EHY58548.1 hypothetical protein HMPREF1120_06557 [Exophiala dermatitidis NIH/UT8656]
MCLYNYLGTRPSHKMMSSKNWLASLRPRHGRNPGMYFHRSAPPSIYTKKTWTRQLTNLHLVYSQLVPTLANASSALRPTRSQIVFSQCSSNLTHYYSLLRPLQPSECASAAAVATTQ